MSEVAKAAPQIAVESERKPPAMTISQSENGRVSIEITGDFSRIAKGAGNDHVSHGILGQTAILDAPGAADAPNFALGFIDSMEPRDAAETLLLTQMAATHQATMMLARRLNQVKTMQQQDAAERALNKLSRTYAAQMETLKRYRSKGQQTVRVERVTVESGGQAVVGDVHHGGRGRGER